MGARYNASSTAAARTSASRRWIGCARNWDWNCGRRNCGAVRVGRSDALGPPDAPQIFPRTGQGARRVPYWPGSLALTKPALHIGQPLSRQNAYKSVWGAQRPTRPRCRGKGRSGFSGPATKWTYWPALRDNAQTGHPTAGSMIMGNAATPADETPRQTLRVTTMKRLTTDVGHLHDHADGSPAKHQPR